MHSHETILKFLSFSWFDSLIEYSTVIEVVLKVGLGSVKSNSFTRTSKTAPHNFIVAVF